MTRIQFIPTERFAGKPYVIDMSAWVYAPVQASRAAGVLRTDAVGTVAIDIGESGLVYGFEISNSWKRKDCAIVVPETGDGQWLMQVASPLEDHDDSQSYDEEKGVLLVRFLDDKGPLLSRRLSASVTVSCTGDDLVALYVEDVWLP